MHVGISLCGWNNTRHRHACPDALTTLPVLSHATAAAPAQLWRQATHQSDGLVLEFSSVRMPTPW
jgi:hypothetical protein